MPLSDGNTEPWNSTPTFQQNATQQSAKQSSKSRGFTLTELLVTTAIIATGAVLILPSFVRSKYQGDVDSYTQTVESGLFNLRAQLGTQISCQLSFLPPINFKPHGNFWNSNSQQVDQPILIALNAAIPKRAASMVRPIE